MTLSIRKVSEARKHLALGRSLDAAARLVGSTPSELDQSLWKRAGQRDPKLRPKPAGHF
jgi:hypothetical protein